MSKKSKTKAKLKRRTEKAARKAAQRALYESYMKQGRNTKSKRAIKYGQSISKVNAISHPEGPCGNIGCQKCNGIFYKPFLRKGQPYDMPNWMWLKWRNLDKKQRARAVQGHSFYA